LENDGRFISVSDSKEFTSDVEVLMSLTEQKSLWWCDHCDKPLFIDFYKCASLGHAPTALIPIGETVSFFY
jgi:hypothetical protein